MKQADLKIKYFGDTFVGRVYDFKTVRFLTDVTLDLFYQVLAAQLGVKSLPSAVRDTVLHDVSVQNGCMSISIKCEKELCDRFGITAEGDLCSEDLQHRLSDDLAKLFYKGMQLREYVARITGNHVRANVVINTEADDFSPSVIKTEKGNIVLKDPKILWAAKMSKNAIDSIFGLLRKGVISNLRVEGLTKPMFLDRSKGGLMRMNLEETDISATARFTGRINNLFFSSQSGTVVAGDKVYPITWGQLGKTKIMEYADVDNVEFLARPVISENAIHASVTTYEIIDCEHKGESILAG